MFTVDVKQQYNIFYSVSICVFSNVHRECPDDERMLHKLSLPGRPTNLDNL